MTRLWWGLTCAVFLAEIIGVTIALGQRDQLALVHDVAGWAATVLAVTGCVRAYTIFAPGEFLRRVWGLLSMGALLLMVGMAMRSYWTHFGGGLPIMQSPLIAPRALVIIAANTLMVAALALVAHTYRRTGIRPPRTPKFLLVWLLVTAAALLLGVPEVVRSLQRFTHLGWPTAMTHIASTIGDVCTLILVVPILRLAYLLRGGSLARPWFALAVSGLMWLTYDAHRAIAELLPWHPATTSAYLQTSRSLGLLCIGLAGWLSWDALRYLGRDDAGTG